MDKAPQPLDRQLPQADDRHPQMLSVSLEILPFATVLALGLSAETITGPQGSVRVVTRRAISFRQIDAFSYSRIARSNSMASRFRSENSPRTRRAETIWRANAMISAGDIAHSPSSIALKATTYGLLTIVPNIDTTPPKSAEPPSSYAQITLCVTQKLGAAHGRNPAKDCQKTGEQRRAVLRPAKCAVK